MSTDSIRRFYVEDRSDMRPSYYAVVDRLDLLPWKRFYTAGYSDLARKSEAVELATSRNRCEVIGGHTFATQGEKCEICDASPEPDILTSEGELL